ncbi:MAG: alpha/beta hydrolase [Chloroflexi bacterium]|nr:alpha/beta hydrolase [Chloroflexota bacterium]
MSGGNKQHGWRNVLIIAVVILIVIITPLSIYASTDIEKKDLDDAARAQQGGSYVRLSNGVTHYELIGPETGQVVVLIHGFSIPMYVWDAQVEPLTQAGFRILRYDMYGKGYSDRPEANYSQAFFRKQLINLLDGLNIQKSIDLVGLSVGGGLAVDFTANFPDRVNKLVLVDPVITSSAKYDSLMKLLGPPVMGEFLMRLVTTKILADRAADLMKKSPKAAEYNNLFRDQTRYKGFERATLSMIRGDAIKDYRADYLTVGQQNKPIMLIWGTLDEDVTPSMVQEIRKAMPNLDFKQLDGIGHDPQVEAPDKVNSLVIDFLKQQ